MATTETEQILRQLRRTFARRKWLIVACVALVLAPVVFFNETQEPTFEAATTLVFDELSGPTPTFQSDGSREMRMANRVQELSSRAFAREVSEALEPADRARFGIPTERPAGFDEADWLAKRVAQSMVPTALRNTSLIRLIVQTHDPVLCAALANTAASVYSARNLRIRQKGVQGIREFVEEQLERFRTQLNEADSALRDYKKDSRMSSFQDHEQEILHRLTEAEVLYNEASTERAALEQRLSTIEENLQRTREEFVPSVTEASDPWMKRLQERLVDLQIQYADLEIQDYDPSHPTLVQLSRDIETTKATLSAEAEKIASQDNLVDPIGQMENYGRERLRVQIEVESLVARETALTRVIRQYEQSLGTLPEKELQLARLTRERDVNQKIYNNLLEKLEQTKISEAENVPTVRIVDTARANPAPIRPRKKVNLLLGVLVGLFAGTGIAFVREAGATAMESYTELEEATGWGALASIPRIARIPAGPIGLPGEDSLDAKELRTIKRYLISILEPNGAATEACRMLRTNLKFRGVGDQMKTILTTSSGPNDGKSTVVTNLAIAFATTGQNVLLVDADLRRPGLHAVFGARSRPGLQELILETQVEGPLGNGRPASSPQDVEKLLAFARRNREEGAFPPPPPPPPVPPKLGKCTVPLQKFVQPTTIDGLSILPAGSGESGVENALASHVPAIIAILAEASARYDVVLIDTPPLALVHDTAILSSLVHGVLFVVNSRHYDRELLVRSQSTLERAGASVIGAILNQVEATGVYKSNEYYYTEKG
ncbi:MAG: hypothetical protein DHS20C21_03690 [Gemmatimonadota bacterium]|nr:MAG: hypothetical protein DHS20C21_03690 [Gemmatimonadota bacterium]